MPNKRIVRDYVPLKDEFLENPFSILDARTKAWQDRKREWLALELEDGSSRENLRDYKGVERERVTGEAVETGFVSTFDPYLAEVMYKWFCPPGGTILDPFCGGATRGVVADKCGYYYTGIDIRPEQIESNLLISNKLSLENTTYLCGDARAVLNNIKDGQFDMVFTCPPYYNLEVYSDLEADLSNMTWNDFKWTYKSIIRKCAEKLKKGGYAVFVVGEVRNRSGFLYGLVPYTIQCFMEAGLIYYNELILSSPVGSAAVRARQGMKSQKVVKIHQNVLVFKRNRVDLELAAEKAPLL